MTTKNENSLAGAPTQANTKQGSVDEMDLDGVPEAEEKEHLASVCRLSRAARHTLYDSCCVGGCARVGGYGSFKLERSSRHGRCGDGRTEEVLDMVQHDLRAHTDAGWKRNALDTWCATKCRLSLRVGFRAVLAAHAPCKSSK